MELCLANAQINVICLLYVQTHPKTYCILLYLLAFCLIDKADVFGMCMQVPQNSINLFPVTRRMQGNPVMKYGMGVDKHVQKSPIQ